MINTKPVTKDSSRILLLEIEVDNIMRHFENVSLRSAGGFQAVCEVLQSHLDLIFEIRGRRAAVEADGQLARDGYDLT